MICWRLLIIFVLTRRQCVSWAYTKPSKRSSVSDITLIPWALISRELISRKVVSWTVTISDWVRGPLHRVAMSTHYPLVSTNDYLR